MSIQQEVSWHVTESMQTGDRQVLAGQDSSQCALVLSRMLCDLAQPSHGWMQLCEQPNADVFAGVSELLDDASVRTLQHMIVERLNVLVRCHPLGHSGQVHLSVLVQAAYNAVLEGDLCVSALELEHMALRAGVPDMQEAILELSKACSAGALRLYANDVALHQDMQGGPLVSPACKLLNWPLLRGILRCFQREEIRPSLDLILEVSNAALGLECDVVDIVLAAAMAQPTGCCSIQVAPWPTGIEPKQSGPAAALAGGLASTIVVCEDLTDCHDTFVFPAFSPSICRGVETAYSQRHGSSRFENASRGFQELVSKTGEELSLPLVIGFVRAKRSQSLGVPHPSGSCGFSNAHGNSIGGPGSVGQWLWAWEKARMSSYRSSSPAGVSPRSFPRCQQAQGGHFSFPLSKFTANSNGTVGIPTAGEQNAFPPGYWASENGFATQPAIGQAQQQTANPHVPGASAQELDLHREAAQSLFIEGAQTPLPSVFPRFMQSASPAARGPADVNMSAASGPRSHSQEWVSVPTPHSAEAVSSIPQIVEPAGPYQAWPEQPYSDGVGMQGWHPYEAQSGHCRKNSAPPARPQGRFATENVSLRSSNSSPPGLNGSLDTGRPQYHSACDQKDLASCCSGREFAGFRMQAPVNANRAASQPLSLFDALSGQQKPHGKSCAMPAGALGSLPSGQLAEASGSNPSVQAVSQGQCPAQMRTTVQTASSRSGGSSCAAYVRDGTNPRTEQASYLNNAGNVAVQGKITDTKVWTLSTMDTLGSLPPVEGDRQYFGSTVNSLPPCLPEEHVSLGADMPRWDEECGEVQGAEARESHRAFGVDNMGIQHQERFATSLTPWEGFGICFRGDLLGGRPMYLSQLNNLYKVRSGGMDMGYRCIGFPRLREFLNEFPGLTVVGTGRAMAVSIVDQERFESFVNMCIHNVQDRAARAAQRGLDTQQLESQHFLQPPSVPRKILDRVWLLFNSLPGRILSADNFVQMYNQVYDPHVLDLPALGFHDIRAFMSQIPFVINLGRRRSGKYSLREGAVWHISVGQFTSGHSTNCA